MLLRLGTVLSIVLVAVQAYAEEKPALASKEEKVSYSIGLDIGMKLKAQSIEVNPDALVKGVKDALSGGETLLTTEEVRKVLTEFQQDMKVKAEEKLKEISGMNAKDGKEFLAANKSKEGIVTLPSGLQYKVLTPGDGKIPSSDDTVTTHYRGTLIDGTEFDSSYKRSEPASFPVNGVIAGWTEALQLMKTGAKWQLFVPAELAYGERGAGQMIGPNSTLVFEVELLSIQ